MRNDRPRRTSRRPPRRQSPPARGSERGVLLVALMVAITVMIILLTASAQSWTAVMKREREEELIFRGNQYIRALMAYQMENGGTFPTELKKLLENGPRGHRYIRQLYTDPFDPEGEWNLLYLGPDGRSAFNPNARLATGVPGLPGAQPAANPFGGQAPGVLGGGVPGMPQPGGGRGGGIGTKLSQRKSGFASGNLNAPIVGVVSKGSEKAFQEYFNKQYYDEWEFHVFLLQVEQVQRGTGQGVNINPAGGIGPGGRGGFAGDPNARDDGRGVSDSTGGIQGRTNQGAGQQPNNPQTGGRTGNRRRGN